MFSDDVDVDHADDFFDTLFDDMSGAPPGPAGPAAGAVPAVASSSSCLASPSSSYSSCSFSSSGSPGDEESKCSRSDGDDQEGMVLDFSASELAPKLDLEDVVELLLAAERGVFAPGAPQRPQASPICPDVLSFYVNPGLKLSLSNVQQERSMGDPAKLVAVRYQGFSNGEVYWSPRHGAVVGLVARNMTRKKRNNMSEHGFVGRWYTLIKRQSASVAVTKADCRDYKAVGAPSFVQFWPSEQDAVLSASAPARLKYRKRRRMASSASASASEDEVSPAVQFGLPPPQPQQQQQQQQQTENMYVAGDLEVGGDLVVGRNVRVKGQLIVDGGICGQLVTPPEAADYAEWFECLDQSENISAGDVVQLRSPEQRITLRTDGDGPIMVVSTTPSVAAGVPPQRALALRGRLVAFLGQVPVKCAGPVRCGDHLVPSGRGDGLAIAGDSRHVDLQPIATAMESCSGKRTDGHPTTVNSFMRWSHNRDWNSKRGKVARLQKTTVTSWRLGFFYAAYLCVRAYFVLFGRHDTLAASLAVPDRWDTPTLASISAKAIVTLELCHMCQIFSNYPVHNTFPRFNFWVGVGIFVLDILHTVTAFFVTSDLFVEATHPGPPPPVSLAQIKSILTGAFFAQAHVLLLICIIRGYVKTRNVLLAMATEAERKGEVFRKSHWEGAIGGRVFSDYSI